MGFRTIRFAASIAFLAGAAVAQGSLFPVSYSYPAVDAPYGSALADLNADGKLDYLVANFFTNKVSVFLGTGNGQFNPLPPITVGGMPRSLVVADMNGDTKLDIVTVNSSANNVSVLLGNGLGGFAAPTLFSTPNGSFPVWIDAGDVNGDGLLDVVVGNQATSDLSVLLGHGSGNLGAPSSFTVGFSPERIKLIDMDGDGDLDCVSMSYLDDRVSVLLGDGNGHFFPSADAYTAGPKGLAVGDLNADGRPDVVVSSSQSGIVSVFFGNGSGGLLAPKNYNLGSSTLYPTAVMIADESGDGRPDLITCNAGSTTSLTVLVGVGGGNFAFALTSPIPESGYDAVAGDLNGDGFPDVVTANLTVDSIRVHIGDGVGSWEGYCQAKANSLGCIPAMRGFGTPSVSNPRPFWVYVTNVLDSKPGLFLYTVNGAQASIPFQGGTLCVGPASIRRTPAQNSGNDPDYPSPNCTGAYALDVNKFAQGLSGGNPAPGLLILGNTYQLQAWSRDPGFTPPNNSGLSSALDVTPWL